MEGTISLKDHRRQMDEAKEQLVDLTSQLEQVKQDHQSAAEQVAQLQQDVEAQKEIADDFEAQLRAEQAGRLEDQAKHQAAIEQLNTEKAEAIKQGVIDSLANQGLEPVDLASKAAKPSYTNAEILQMPPVDRALVMRKIRQGQAEITD